MLRRIGIGVAIASGALLALVAGTALLLRALDLDRYKGSIERVLRDATGREARIEGSFELDLLPRPAVAVEGLTLANVPWGSRPEMVRVGSFEVVVRLLPLLRGRLSVRRVVLNEPRILLETDADGRGNWSFGVSEEETKEAVGEADRQATQLGLSELRVEDATIELRDGETGEVDTLRLGSYAIRARGDRFQHELRGELGEQELRIEGETARLRTLLRNRRLPFELEASLGGATLDLDGSLERPLDGRGLALRAEAHAESLADLSAAAGAGLPPVPLRLALSLEEEDWVFRVSDLALELGASRFTGSLALDLSGARPELTGALLAPLLDLDAGDEAAASSPPAPAGDGRVFSADPLPLDGLRAADADVTFEAERLLAGGVELEASSLRLLLRDGRLTLEPLRASLAGGLLMGRASVDAADSPPSFALRMQGSGIDLGALVEQAVGPDVLSGGTTKFEIDLVAQGASLRSLMASLDGRVFTDSGRGVVHDADLDRLGAGVLTQVVTMVDPLAKTETSTRVKCAVLFFDVRDGIAETDRAIAVETRKMRVVGSGKIDFRQERLALGIRPESTGVVDFSTVRLASLVYLGGSFAEPKPTLDLQAAAMEAAGVGLVFATFGASLLAEAVLADAEPCRTARQKARTAAARAPGTKAPRRKKSGLGGLVDDVLGR
ncbi:MAG: AsmA family protein [Myxococcota bacterium]|nr:AsmA family protein [Myxococcota bacterium]